MKIWCLEKIRNINVQEYKTIRIKRKHTNCSARVNNFSANFSPSDAKIILEITSDNMGISTGMTTVVSSFWGIFLSIPDTTMSLSKTLASSYSNNESSFTAISDLEYMKSSNSRHWKRKLIICYKPIFGYTKILSRARIQWAIKYSCALFAKLCVKYLM